MSQTSDTNILACEAIIPSNERSTVFKICVKG